MGRQMLEALRGHRASPPEEILKFLVGKFREERKVVLGKTFSRQDLTQETLTNTLKLETYGTCLELPNQDLRTKAQ